MLSIPVARQSGGGDFWWERQSAQLALADEWGVLFVHRQVGTAYPAAQGWRSVDEAFGYFDTWLRARGWDIAERGFDDPVMPESRLLDPANHRAYFRSGDRSAKACRDLADRRGGRGLPCRCRHQQAVIADANWQRL